MFFSKVEPIVAVLMSKIIKTTVDYRIAKRNEMKLKMNATTSKRRVSYQNTQSWNIAGKYAVELCFSIHLCCFITYII